MNENSFQMTQFFRYLFNVAYGAGKTSLDRMTADMAVELEVLFIYFLLIIFVFFRRATFVSFHFVLELSERNSFRISTKQMRQRRDQR